MIKKIIKSIFNGSFIRQFRQKLFLKSKKAKKLSDEEYLIKAGKFNLGYKMDLKNPKTFNEKINWYKLNYKNDLMPKLVDKVLVDEYVKEKGLEDILTKKLAIWNNPDEIDLSNLPNMFVLKTNHDSGGVLICKDKSKFDKSNLEKIYNSYNKNFTDNYKEWPYALVNKKVFAEEYIKTTDGRSPKDYKIFCFDGEPKFLFVASNRDKDVKFDFFDASWNWIDVRQGHKNAKITPEKPKNFDRMIEISRILSKDFPHVRIDLYNENGIIRFGEMTFFHNAGMIKFNPKKYDLIFGEYFNVDKIKDEFKDDNRNS